MSEMFNNPDFDPLSRLEFLEQQMAVLQHDKMELVKAINHQAEALNKMNHQIVLMNNQMAANAKHLKMLEIANSRLVIKNQE